MPSLIAISQAAEDTIAVCVLGKAPNPMRLNANCPVRTEFYRKFRGARQKIS